jgi:hypothetical protein
MWRARRRSALGSAGLFLAAAAVFAFLASPSASPVLRTFATLICVGFALFFAIRALGGLDPLADDLRQLHVESVEGAIGKRRFGAGRAPATYLLDVGDRSFRVSRGTYGAAPEAGLVRVYFLPRSRKIVNMERLPDAPLSGQVTPQALAQSFDAVSRSHGRREMNEARAGLARLTDALSAGVANAPTAPPPHARDPRPLAEAIVGTWTSALMRVTFTAGGTVEISMAGTTRNGRWSVDASERLTADLTGEQATADAWIAQDRLTIVLDGRGLTFTRAA